jgi:peptidoglycan hydrolase-like protein with peptidoglycan-binding domain
VKKCVTVILVIILLFIFVSPQIAMAAPAMRQGSKGNDVVEMQKRLIELGYLNDRADGSFGPLTLKAVKDFQKANGLVADGICGPKTQSILYSNKAVPASNQSRGGSSNVSIPITRTLRKGSKGSDVAELQRRLNELGFNAGKIDGSFGSQTLNAVYAFQKSRGLVVDGVVGKITRAALYEEVSSPTPTPKPTPKPTVKPDPTTTPSTQITVTLRRGSKGSQVEALQRRLIELGFDCGAIDGSFGPATQKAVIEFQLAYGLVGDGVVGPLTRAKLNAGGKPTTPTPTPKPTPKPTVKPDPTATPSTQITVTLRRGSKGSQVEALQRRLIELGFDCGAIDGSFGPATQKAVIEFQLAYGLVGDGVVGPLTRAKLNAGGKPTTPQPEKEMPDTDALKGKIIILDPGHGGSDWGASSNGYLEKNLNLDMALKLRDMLENAGATVYMTRTDDRYVSLFYRSAYANKVVLELEIDHLEHEKIKLTDESETIDKKIQLIKSDNSALNEYKEAIIVLIELLSKTKEESYETQEPGSSESTEIKEILDFADDSSDKADTHISTELPENILNQLIIANEHRNNLRQSVKDQLVLGNESITPENLDDLESILDSIEAAKNMNNTAISVLEDKNKTLLERIQNVKDEISEVHRLLCGFQPYFDNPANQNRTGIYTVTKDASFNVASADLQKVMDLTRKKYQDNILFISIHCNATVEKTQTYISGMYVFYRNNNPKANNNRSYYKNYNETARQKLASKLLIETNKSTNFIQSTSQPRVDDFSVLRENNLVSALVEVGFMNNPHDLNLIIQDSVRTDAAYGMLKGIISYFE